MSNPVAEEWVRLRWEKDTRYYEAHLHQDLWGGWVLTKVWGRRGSALGRVVHSRCESYDEARMTLEAVQKRRGHRGYCQISINLS